MSFWISSGAFKAKHVTDLLDEASKYGIYGLELSSGLQCSQNETSLLEETLSAGQQKYLVHNYFPAPSKPFVLNIASKDEDNSRQSMSMAINGIKLASKLNSPFYSIHAGFAAKIKPELLGKPKEQADSLRAEDIDRDTAYLNMINNTRILSKIAESHGVRLLIENNVISPVFLSKSSVNPLLLTSYIEIIEFFDNINCSNVGLLLDVAHVKVSSTALNLSPYSFIDKVSSYIECLHLSDNNGQIDSNQPLRRDSWFYPLIKDFKDREIVLEAYNLPKEVVASQLHLLEDSFS